VADDEPDPPGGNFLTTKSVLLLIIAGVVAYLCAYRPHIGAALVAAITVLALLWRIVR
jgi:hypothetical protein